jgi:hypothetical protein
MNAKKPVKKTVKRSSKKPVKEQDLFKQPEPQEPEKDKQPCIDIEVPKALLEDKLVAIVACSRAVENLAKALASTQVHLTISHCNFEVLGNAPAINASGCN